MAQRWLILGAGGHGRSVCDAIAASGDHVVGYLDDALPAGTLVNATPVLGALSLAWDLKRLFEASLEAPPDLVVVAIGNPALRQTWQQVLEQVAVPLGVVLHPRAIVSATAQLGPVTWTPETEPALMRASLQARIGQEKPHETQTPQPRADHSQTAHRGAAA